MAKASAQNEQQSNEKVENVEVPEYLHTNFDDLKGESFGGSSDILALEENEAAGPLTYLGNRPFDPGTGKAVTLHEARDGQNHTWRLPIAANFLRQVETANLNPGDTFAMKRLPDAIKKKGIGAGNKMQMFMIKVLNRVTT